MVSKRFPRELGMFPAMLRLGLADLFAFRAQVVIWILTTTMPLIMYSLWSTVAREAPVGRFDEPTFAAYFLSTLVVRQLSSSWVVWELNEHIRTGELTATLLRPVHPLWFFAAESLAATPFRLAVLMPLVGLSIALLPRIALVATPLHICLYLWTIMMAWVLTFLIQSIIGSMAFFTERSLALQEAWFGLWSMLSGYLIPLELMPRLMRLAIWLPFRSMGSLPTEIILGHLSGRSLWSALVTQLAWVVSAFGLLRWVWSKAITHFEAYGN